MFQIWTFRREKLGPPVRAAPEIDLFIRVWNNVSVVIRHRVAMLCIDSVRGQDSEHEGENI